MLPSVSEFDLDYPYLRSHWENIAVLDDELHVQDDKIIISQNGKADKAYLLKTHKQRKDRLPPVLVIFMRWSVIKILIYRQQRPDCVQVAGDAVIGKRSAEQILVGHEIRHFHLRIIAVAEYDRKHAVAHRYAVPVHF